MKVILIFITGLGILAGAIILNILSSKVGLMGWYDFIADSSKAGVLDYIWLFILYPLGLGTVSYYLVSWITW